MLRVGIAGFGVVGARRKHYLDMHPDTEVVAVCDRVPNNLENLNSSISCHSDFSCIIKEDLDILFVCLTNDIAAKVTIEALNKGLHVFCEKPPGQNVEDILSVRLCESEHPKLKLMYGFNHRFHDSVQDSLKIIQSGELGKVINMRAIYGKAKMITFNQPDWRTKRDIAGGGVLLDQGIHMVDLMRYLGGEFDEVKSFISNNYWGYDVEDNAYALLRNTDGVVGMLHSSATQWRHRFNLDINLEKGSLILGGILSGTKSYGAETLMVVTSDPENDSGDPKEVLTRYNNDPSWKKEIDTFVDSILKDKAIKSGNSEDSLKTMQLVYKIYYEDKPWREKYNIEDPTAAS